MGMTTWCIVWKKTYGKNSIKKREQGLFYTTRRHASAMFARKYDTKNYLLPVANRAFADAVSAAAIPAEPVQ
jgi:hypothetical protein